MTEVHCGNVTGHLKPYKQFKKVALLVNVAMLLVQVKRLISGGGGGVVYFL